MIGTGNQDEYCQETIVIVFREISDIRIACWVDSENFAGGRKTLVFVHGSGGDHRLWIKQYTKFKDEFNIVVIDLPGHGQSSGKGAQDALSYVECVRRLLESLSLKKPVLIGHSLGAAISLVFAIQYGEMLSGVVPVGGGVTMPVNEMILKDLKTNPEFVIGMIAKFSVSKENRERLMRTVIDGLSCASPDVLYGDLLACNRLDITGQVSRIGIPTLVLCGADDKMTPPALSQFLGDNIPGAQLSLIENAGHMVMLENVDAFNRLLRAFVESLPAV
jgi:pimeloyl-ACP methyl ester carboxylesterase